MIDQELKICLYILKDFSKNMTANTTVTEHIWLRAFGTPPKFPSQGTSDTLGTLSGIVKPTCREVIKK